MTRNLFQTEILLPFSGEFCVQYLTQNKLLSCSLITFSRSSLNVTCHNYVLNIRTICLCDLVQLITYTKS